MDEEWICGCRYPPPGSGIGDFVAKERKDEQLELEPSCCVSKRLTWSRQPRHLGSDSG